MQNKINNQYEFTGSFKNLSIYWKEGLYQEHSRYVKTSKPVSVEQKMYGKEY